MKAKLVISVPFGDENPVVNNTSLPSCKKEAKESIQNGVNKCPNPSDKDEFPDIQYPLFYKVDVEKNSALYRQLPKSIKAELPIMVKSSNPIYSHWVAMYGVLFQPTTVLGSEPLGRRTYLIDATTGKELLIDSLDQPDAELLKNLHQEYKLFELHGFDKDLRTDWVEADGKTYQIIDDSLTHLNNCPDLQIKFSNVA